MKLIWTPGDSSASLTFPDTVGTVEYIVGLNYAGFSGAPVAPYTVKGPRQEGESNLGPNYSPRKISFEVLVQAATLQGLLDAQRALVSAFDAGRGEGQLIWEQEDATQYLLNCSPNGECPQALTGDSNRGPLFQRYSFPMIATNPFWYSGSPHTATFTFTAKSLFPFNFPFNFESSRATVQSLTNAGSRDTPAYVIFYGPMRNPSLVNATTGKSIALNLDLAAGEQFVIDCDPNELYATYYGTSAIVNGAPYLDDDTILSDFVLGSGANSVYLAAAWHGAGAYATVQWSDKYAGV